MSAENASGRRVEMIKASAFRDFGVTDRGRFRNHILSSVDDHGLHWLPLTLV